MLALFTGSCMLGFSVCSAWNVVRRWAGPHLFPAWHAGGFHNAAHPPESLPGEARTRNLLPRALALQRHLAGAPRYLQVALAGRSVLLRTVLAWSVMAGQSASTTPALAGRVHEVQISCHVQDMSRATARTGSWKGFCMPCALQHKLAQMAGRSRFWCPHEYVMLICWVFLFLLTRSRYHLS